MKRVLFVLGMGLLLASCGNNSSTEPSSSQERESVLPSSSQIISTSSDISTGSTLHTITFDTKGGSYIEPLSVVHGEKASEPATPSKDGYEFGGWFKDIYCVAPFSFDTVITADWVIYAQWIETSHPSSSASSSESSSSSDTSSSQGGEHCYGPEGSQLVSWYLCGGGSLWGNDGWSLEGGIQLYSNPNSTTDKGCLLSVPFQAGDTFKVTNGTTWYGYEKVDPAETETNLGKTCFEGVSDGFGGSNFHCTVSGNYDFYVNGSGVFWIQAHA